MSLSPFQTDASIIDERLLARLPPQGSQDIKAFCGVDDTEGFSTYGPFVLMASKGYGKSHLLRLRSARHRDSESGGRMVFYPQGGVPRHLVHALTQLKLKMPRWLQGREAIPAWSDIWQLSIFGLLARLVDADGKGLRDYPEWFHGPTEMDERVLDIDLKNFIGRVIQRLPGDDFQSGTDLLKEGLYRANSEWSLSIKSALQALHRSSVVLYLDSPDELVTLTEQGVWRNLQQGLLLAIWQMKKDLTWSSVVKIYASVRTEAFGGGVDANIHLAMNFVLPLHYDATALEAMLDDRIAAADPLRLDKTGSKPIHTLCGLERVEHDDRKGLSGGRYSEDILQAIFRHTRLVPREVIWIADWIYRLTPPRKFDQVKQAVNGRAVDNIQWATEQVFPGWTKRHEALAFALPGEVIPFHAIESMILADSEDSHPESADRKLLDPEKAEIVKSFIRYGLLGAAEPYLQRHRHCYRQQFSYAESTAVGDSVSLAKDYFFVHPAFREWIEHGRGSTGYRMALHEAGVIGNGEVFESQRPLVRLELLDNRIVVWLHDKRLTPVAVDSQKRYPLRFLALVLCACRERMQPRVNYSELTATLEKLQTASATQRAIRLPWPKPLDAVRAKFKEWQGEIHEDEAIRNFQQAFHGRGSRKKRKSQPRAKTDVPPLLGVSGQSSLDAEVEVHFHSLPMAEVDWDDQLAAVLKGPHATGKVPAEKLV